MGIALVTSYGYEGSGDFVFIQNTAHTILKEWPGEELVFVSQPEGIQIYTDILKVNHPNIHLYDIDTFNHLVESKKLVISLYIEGPVFNIDMHTDDKKSQAVPIGPDLMTYKTTTKIKIPAGTPVLLMPEYGKMAKTDTDMLALQRELRRQGIEDITVIRTGLNQRYDQKGIYFNEHLLKGILDPKEKLYDLLSKNKSDKVFIDCLTKGKSIGSTFSEKDISIEYSKGNCSLFIIMHAIWARSRAKDQILVGIGAGYKETQLRAQLPELQKHYSSIVYIDLNTKKKITLYVNDTEQTKTYTFIHVNRLTHQTLLALILLSGPIMGATGDGSLAEALSARKVIAYECLEYKVDLAKGLTSVLSNRNDSFRDIFKEFIGRPAQGTPRILSDKATLFLQSEESIMVYQQMISDLHIVCDLGPTLIETIEQMREIKTGCYPLGGTLMKDSAKMKKRKKTCAFATEDQPVNTTTVPDRPTVHEKNWFESSLKPMACVLNRTMFAHSIRRKFVLSDIEETPEASSDSSDPSTHRL